MMLIFTIDLLFTVPFFFNDKICMLHQVSDFGWCDRTEDAGATAA
jgi:hypothetical protein